MGVNVPHSITSQLKNEVGGCLIFRKWIKVINPTLFHGRMIGESTLELWKKMNIKLSNPMTYFIILFYLIRFLFVIKIICDSEILISSIIFYTMSPQILYSTKTLHSLILLSLILSCLPSRHLVSWTCMSLILLKCTMNPTIIHAISVDLN